MMLQIPKHLSPSAISTFTACPAQYRFAYLERLEQIPSPVPLQGSLVHLALQHLLWRPAHERTFENALLDLDRASREMTPEILEMLTACSMQFMEILQFFKGARKSVRSYFKMEDPTQVDVMGVELRMQYTTAKGTVLHGVIDRLERLPDGRLQVVDYKTGKAPKEGWEHDKLAQVHVYAAMCEQTLGVLPDFVQLMYLSTAERITIEPKQAQMRSVTNRADAAMIAIKRAVEKEDFRTKVSKLCDYCSFKGICPAWA